MMMDLSLLHSNPGLISMYRGLDVQFIKLFESSNDEINENRICNAVLGGHAVGWKSLGLFSRYDTSDTPASCPSFL
jgi:hypothetical protein